MHISSLFDSGNIEVVSCESADDIQLRIPKDSNSEFLQWFHFRLSGTKGATHRIKIVNAGEAAYLEGWEDYSPLYSYDAVNWQRLPAKYADGVLEFDLELEFDTVYFSYFYPYSYARHQSLVGGAQLSPRCELWRLGATVDGRDLDLLVVGDEKADTKVWVIARQHPGETMAQWCAEGLLGRLLDEDDAVSRKLLDDAVFYVVPNMNPDGGYRGNLRSNAAGANLNREWLEPSMERSPEVFLVRKMMQDTGVDVFLDLHGDEALPYNFVAASEGVPGYTARMSELEESFKASLTAANPDFQTEYGYPKDEPGKADLSIATNWIGENFKCLSLTLEMPFKDNANFPDPEFGWSPQRSQLLGESLLTAVLAVLPKVK